jgi:outer membrane protein assembly factor BamB
MMRRHARFALVVTAALCAAAGTLGAQDHRAANGQWPQFLGPGGAGVGDDDASLPTEFGPSKALLWKTEIPAGVGSPCVWGDRVFVTAFDEETQKLEVIAVDRKNGEIAWRRTVASEGIEEVHAMSSPATSTPATDGHRVYVYFGSYGLLAYEWDGTLAWEHPMGVAKMPFGSGTSPVLIGDLVLMTRDYPPEPYMIALNRGDGTLVWKATLAPRTSPGPKGSHATPVIWRGQIVLHRSGEVSAYDPADGTLAWRVDTLSPGTSTPSPSSEALYVTAFPMLADPANAGDVPPFPVVLSRYDTNGDGKLSEDELPDDELFLFRRAGVPDGVPGAHLTVKRLFGMIDSDKDGAIDEANLDEFNKMLDENFGPAAVSSTGLIAIHAGSEGDRPAAAVKWTYERNVPEVSSPMSYGGRVYMIKSGGIVSCVDAASGEALYRGRVGAPGTYYASPVMAGGRIFVASGEGVVSVLGTGDTLEVLANNDLGDPIYSTPAPVGSALYVRSDGHLWAFGTRSAGSQVTTGVP